MNLKEIKQSFANLKIKHKLIFLITTIMLLITSFNLISTMTALNVYDNRIYSQSEMLLNMTSSSLEKELKEIEDLSLEIATNSAIQTYLNVPSIYNEYDNYRRTSAIIDSMLEMIDSFKYISAIEIIDNQSYSYAIGTHRIQRYDSLNNVNEISNQNGSNVWIYPNGRHSMLISGREIRQTSNLTLSSLGQLFIYIDINALVENITLDSYKDDHLYILKDENLIYPTGNQMNFTHLSNDHFRNPGYDIVPIDGQKHFITHMKSQNTDWTYYNIIPYQDEFQSTNLIKKMIIIVYLGLFVIVLSIGYYFSKTITEPIERLMTKIKEVQKGVFSSSKLNDVDSHKQDEIGQLHYHFQKMVENTDQLIKENYDSQLIIKETEYKALQSQINPHFLYNSLQSINWLAKSADQKEISVMVEALGVLLRNSINNDGMIIPIQKELDIIDNYIAIQKIRFGSRLNFTMEIDEDIQKYLIPKLILQPIVENAVHYGVETMIDECHISVVCKRKLECIIISVIDNGPGMTKELLEKVRNAEVKSKGTGIGLMNIRKRIKSYFGEPYGLCIQSDPLNGTRVTVYIPYKSGDEHA
ncbi:sensor histidine kinase [Halalkalibacter sp. APA_J-10(15)]|uniref:sensor histidine kinase n=1 Tax=Halalkalibacter sp. APA_J-10(15) TaxID=2933805 RepID=UPI001FF1BFD2|nr:sensor histidine kinase [Halalkalibacter sp. APA_J-10(15)]MCK0472804.1 sensor histidine kinase [Halalkalibacter sp. APA_J-10(15)]